MSRQRPYETFEKAFFNYLMMDDTSRNNLNKLLDDMKYFENNVNWNEDISMRIPWPYLTKYKDIGILWSCLSRLFGEQDLWISECEIPRKHIHDAIEYIESIMADIIEDNQINEVMKRG